LNQRGRGEGLRGQLVRIQWRGEVLSWLGMTAERGWGRRLIIQWRGGLGGQVEMAERGQWRGSGGGRSEIMGQIEGDWGG